MRLNSVSIIDYGIGNIYSVQRAFEYCGAKVALVKTPEEIRAAERLVLPGVGAFSRGMQFMRERNLIDPLMEYVKSGKPLLGICLGMQMFATISEEFGQFEGLNLIPGRVVALPKKNKEGCRLKAPNIGWSSIYESRKDAWSKTIFSDTQDGASFYLVHSYSIRPDNESDVLACCDYGEGTIVVAVSHQNIIGLQFHPEKSGKAGLMLIKNFIQEKYF